MEKILHVRHLENVKYRVAIMKNSRKPEMQIRQDEFLELCK